MRNVAIAGAGSVLMGGPEPGEAGAFGSLWVDGERRLRSLLRLADRKRSKLMAPDVVAAHLAVASAMEQAAFTELDSQRSGVFCGTRLSARMHPRLAESLAKAAGPGEADAGGWFEEVVSKLNPVYQLMYLSNRSAMHLAITLGVRGPVRSFGGSSCASAHAIAEAMEAIQFGEIDRAIVGGVDLGEDPFGCLLEWVAGAEPDRGAACFLVLEAEDHARARGAPIRGWIHDAACPSVSEGAEARRAALESIGVPGGFEPLLSLPPPAWLPPGNAAPPASILNALESAKRAGVSRPVAATVSDRDLAAAAFLVEAA